MRSFPSILAFSLLTSLLGAQPDAVAPGTATVAPNAGPASEAAKPGVSSGEALLDLATWLAERGAALAIRERTYDPFGKVKDPLKTPPPPVVDPAIAQNPGNEPEAPPVDRKQLFAGAVAGIKISMVGDGEFTVPSGPTLRQGQIFTLSAEGQQFATRVIKVSSSALLLEDTANGHRVELPLNFLPAGMQKGIDPAGIEPEKTSPDTPPVLEIDASSAP